MSRSTNPLATIVARISAEVQPAANATAAAFTNTSPGNVLDKTNLDRKVNDLSQGIGSGSNWAGVAAFGKTYTPIGGAEINSAVGNKSGIATLVQKGANTLQSAAAGIANGFSDLNRLASSANKLTGGNVAGAIQNFAAKVSGAAGQINNLLSLARGKDIPKGAELFADQTGATEIESNADSDWRVRIRLQSAETYYELLGKNPFVDLIVARRGVVWPYTPNLTLTTKANYTSIDSVHNNYPFYAYKNSSVDDITISGDWSVETTEDAENWIAATMFFRTVTKMFFGQSTNSGNPPPICVLDGYGASVFKNIPVIVKSFSVDFKEDVNYINYPQTSTWVPILSTISVTVAPIYSRSRLRQFNLQNYAAGKMIDSQGVGFL
jgi:hypothetical protein